MKPRPKGLGTVQKAVLSTMTDETITWTVRNLVDWTGSPKAQVNAALRALEVRGLVAKLDPVTTYNAKGGRQTSTVWVAL